MSPESTLAGLFMASRHENTFSHPLSETKHNPAVNTSVIKIETIVANRYMTATVESQFLDPTKETKIVSRNWEVQENGGKITKKFIQGNRKLVREIRRFEKSRVQEIGIPLYIQVYLSKMSSESSNMASIQHVFAVVKTQEIHMPCTWYVWSLTCSVQMLDKANSVSKMLKHKLYQRKCLLNGDALGYHP